MKKILFLVILNSVVLFSNRAYSECGFRKEPDLERLFMGPKQAYYAVQSYAHFDDGPGYNHYTGSIQIFDKLGQTLGTIKLKFDDPGDGAGGPKNAHILISCPEFKAPVPEPINKRLNDYCKSPFDSDLSKSDPKSILIALEQFIKILDLKLIDNNKCIGKIKVKVDPPITEYSENADGKLKWGRLQIVASDQNLKTELSILRRFLPPNSFWNASLFGCVSIENQETAVVRNYTYLFCEGEGDSSFSAFPADKKAIASAQKNVEGLRLIKKKKYKEALAILKNALELDPSNELAYYNLASALTLLDPKDKNIEINLKSFIALSLKQVAPSLYSKSKVQDLEAILKSELKAKIRNDSDLKKLDPIVTSRLFN